MQSELIESNGAKLLPSDKNEVMHGLSWFGARTGLISITEEREEKQKADLETLDFPQADIAVVVGIRWRESKDCRISFLPAIQRLGCVPWSGGIAMQGMIVKGC